MQFVKRFFTWWKGQGLVIQLVSGLALVIVGCCFCSIPLVIFSSGATSTPEVVAEVGSANTLLPTPRPVEPTNTPLPTPVPILPTEIPTDTAEPVQPTNTPLPAATPVPPTETPVDTPTPAPPTETPTPAPPTNTPLPIGPKVVIVTVDKKAEYVDIQNVGDQPQDLGGWRLFSEKGEQDCSLNGIIQPGETLRIWAAAEDAGEPGYNCGFNGPIWNNSEPDPAVLFDANDQEADRR